MKIRSVCSCMLWYQDGLLDSMLPYQDPNEATFRALWGLVTRPEKVTSGNNVVLIDGFVYLCLGLSSLHLRLASGRS